MKIIPIHYKISKPIAKYGEIKEIAEEMKRFIVFGDFKGYYNKAFAIAHCQVSETPMAFFVVSPECVEEKRFEDQIIINPEIIETPKHKNIAGNRDDLIRQGLDPDKIKAQTITVSNTIEYMEPCMSFPFRKPKRVERFDVIKVKYQIKGLIGLKTIEKEMSGLTSEIFQHELDHLQGKNLYHDSEVPVKWWELIGSPKPTATNIWSKDTK